MSSFSLLQAVLLDMDGTLADTIPDILAVFNALLAEDGRAPLTPASLVATFGPTEEEILAGLLPGVPEAEIRRRLARRLEGAPPMAPHAGVTGFVDACRRRGYRVGVFTGAGRLFGASRLARLGLADRVDAFVAGDDVATRKPDPAGLRLLCERLGVAPADAVYVGDSPLDVACAQRAGARAVAVSWGVTPAADLAAARPDALVDDFAALARLLALAEA